MCKQALVLQVCAYVRNIDDGADGYNEAWDAWADKQNLPVRLEMLNCAVPALYSSTHDAPMHNVAHACCVHCRSEQQSKQS